MITREDIYKLVISSFINIVCLAIAITLMLESIYAFRTVLLCLSLAALFVMVARWYMELQFIKSVQSTGEVLSFIEKAVPVLDVLTLLLTLSNGAGLITLTIWP